MRRLCLLAIGFGVASFAACDRGIMVAPEASLSSTGPPTLAIGSGHVPAAGGLRNLTFHATKNAEGTATGRYTVRLTSPGLFFTVDVSCMTVEGNTAWIAGHITESNAGFIQIGSVSYFYAIDNGEGTGSPGDIVSTARINDVQGQDLVFCSDKPLLLASFPIQMGSVQIQ